MSAAGNADTVHVVGATGRTGAVLCRMLAARGTRVVAVVRNAARWQALGIPGEAFVADLADPASMQRALDGAARVVSVSYAAWTHVLLDTAPASATLVVTGTARRFVRAPDAAGDAARVAEAQILGSGRNAAILHPTMIYGPRDDGTVRRLAAMMARWRVLPLPGGGRHLVQPVYVDDVAAALIATLDRESDRPAALAIGGPRAVSYASLLNAIAAATGRPSPLILPLPEGLVRLAGRRRPALLRLVEDRVVDVSEMIEALGVVPRSLADGLAKMFGPGADRTDAPTLY